MGYGFYFIDGRPCGYNVLATRGCKEEVDRGMGYCCGGEPHDRWSDLPGCGGYFCAKHECWVGPRGGCSHRRWRRLWGRILSCMVQSPGGTYCLTRTGHTEPHAWEVELDEEPDGDGAFPRRPYRGPDA